MSLAGAIADARKSATRLYINNFADQGRQNTIDMLLVSPKYDKWELVSSCVAGSISGAETCTSVRPHQRLCHDRASRTVRSPNALSDRF